MKLVFLTFQVVSLRKRKYGNTLCETDQHPIMIARMLYYTIRIDQPTAAWMLFIRSLKRFKRLRKLMANFPSSLAFSFASSNGL